MPFLDQVTLVSVTGVHVDAAHAAMVRSMKGLRFAAARLISSEPPTRLDPRIEWIQIPPMTLTDYSWFILKDLYRHVDTSHVLIVQADGFVLNSHLWDPRWLEYDYIGAPFPPIIRVAGTIIHMKNLVGNGGFCLRSKRLMEIVAPIKPETLKYPANNEDLIICHLLYDFLTERGVRFADSQTAARFSIEAPSASFGFTLDTSFGFHGKIYLPQVQERDAFLLG